MKIFLMQQTHTDIGYTDRQEKITKFHIDYIKQAIRISEKIDQGFEKFKGFVWNNESFWIIERFLESTDNQWKQRLLEAINRGHIQLTSNYLNLSDLVDIDILKKYLKKAQQFGEKHQIRIDSAISMDVNGWSYGYLDAMLEAGVKHFYTCVHNHHGLVPFNKIHMPFYWENESGEKLLVWHGDHYAEGNAADIHAKVMGEVINQDIETQAIVKTEQLERIKNYLDDYMDSMHAQGYTFDFLPLMSLGLFVDNAPPNAHVMEVVSAFNQVYEKDYQVEMIGIHDFFDYVKSLPIEIPTYKGDWNDWWSDGYMSTPQSVVDYKEALRNYRKIILLQKNGVSFDQSKIDTLEYQLIMFAEHTWGYFTSVSEPWNKMTKKLQSRKEMFAAKANELADILLDDFTESHGEILKSTGRPLHYEVINPYPNERIEMIKFYINWWDEFIIKDGYQIRNTKTDTVLDHQEIRIDENARREIRTTIVLKPYERLVLKIEPVMKRKRLVPLDPLITNDTDYDFISPYVDTQVFATSFYIETPYMKLAWSKALGIHTFFDKKIKENLIRKDSETGLFTPIYEKSEVEYQYKMRVPEMRSIRGDYGRNRKIFSTLRDYGRLINVKVYDKGPLVARVHLKYQMKGSTFTIVELTAYHNQPRLDVSLIMQKDTVWEPESIYLAMPLTTQNSNETLYIDKVGSIIRPRVDQLPYSCALFYTTQIGYALSSEKRSILVNLKDTPLLHLGSLEPGLIVYHDKKQPNVDKQYIWVMNNYWETNFATNLGGFYKFDYSIFLDQPTSDKKQLLENLKNLERQSIIFQSLNK
ncbi:hypothetical protein [Peloplasma aerotolerans]|uniref:Glycoside hydrolase family 38 N-terminal domain-containing protein n=1 Tax=Peloplasma aerotolerans TaxID=3044389 RepID=A0AAW6U8K2_9MOLU|nr:hypothetical protein [Mariniplasma sp. M4Ah]MDI6452418.1 hypothetical protein [Mariniplasma sp. M4Ah]